VDAGDLAPMFNLRRKAGVNNYVTSITGNIPVGRYDPDRLANLGIGHQARSMRARPKR
jgi:hypothetical protein